MKHQQIQLSDFLGTGIDTEYITIILVIFSIVVAFIIYHLQKPRPKLRIELPYTDLPQPEDHLQVSFVIKNYGHAVAENIQYKITPIPDGVLIKNTRQYSGDLHVNDKLLYQGDIFINNGEKCKIKFEISWDNNTHRWPKRNHLKRKYLCTRTSHITDFKKINW